MKNLAIAIILFSLFSATAWSQSASSQSSDNDFVGKWFQRSSRADAEQPHWMAPVFTVTPRLVQQVRYDIGWQSKAGLTTTNYGSGRGLELIPAERAEILISLPPYITHSSPQIRDGFGDMAFLFKYRAAAGNEKRGNYIVTALFGATVPTGSYTNGAPHALLTPSLGLGKGWGNFDVQSTVGVTLPTGDITTIGTPVAFNAAFQYRILKKLWPELEVNSTFWANGKNDGKKQVFLSPGLMVGRLHLWKRLGLAFGGGVQIAATKFHNYDRNWVMSVRFPF